MLEEESKISISIDWPTKVISVNKVDMTQIQVTPTPIYELDLNVFRLTLKDLEDDVEGITWPKTHNHNPPFNLGGVTLARTVELVNDYTVTFEDDQYAVNLVGANSNIGDRVNVNQVSVRSANSAGLVTSAAIEFGEYDGAVTIDANNITGAATDGSIYPTGTLRQPVDNIPDAVVIAAARGFSKINIIGDLTLGSGDDVEDFSLIGVNPTQTLLTIGDSAATLNCEIKSCKVTGILDGNSLIEECIVEDLSYIYGIISDSWLSGSITLAGGNNAHFLNCHSGVIGDTFYPTIDCGDSGQNLAIRNYHGAILIKNKNGDSDHVILNMSSGEIILDSTVTAGDIVCSGIAKLTDNSNGAIIYDELLNPINIAKPSWDVIHYDTTLGDSGTLYPLGTKRYPINNITDGISIATTNNIKTFNITNGSSITLTQSFNGWIFEAFGAGNSLVLNGQDIDKANFTNLTISGNAGDGTFNAIDCKLSNTGNLQGTYQNCLLSGTLTFDSGMVYFNDVNSTGDSTIFDYNGDSTNIIVIDSHLIIHVTNMTSSNSVLNCSLQSGAIIIDNTCTNGQILLGGNIGLTNNGDSGIIINKSYTSQSLFWNYIDEGDTTTYIMLTEAWNLAGGNRLITNNREYFYDSSGDTMAAFTLLDSSGDSTMTNVYQRVKFYPT